MLHEKPEFSHFGKEWFGLRKLKLKYACEMLTMPKLEELALDRLNRHLKFNSPLKDQTQKAMLAACGYPAPANVQAGVNFG